MTEYNGVGVHENVVESLNEFIQEEHSEGEEPEGIWRLPAEIEDWKHYQEMYGYSRYFYKRYLAKIFAPPIRRNQETFFICHEHKAIYKSTLRLMKHGIIDHWWKNR